jgi:hypothetical protein
MAMDISIQLDTREFEARMNASAKEIVKALRTSVNKAAREARREFISAHTRPNYPQSPDASRPVTTMLATTNQWSRRSKANLAFDSSR